MHNLRRLRGSIRTDWRQFWLLELPALVLFGLALPLQSFYQQGDAYNYLSELWLPWLLYAVAAAGVALLYHLTLRTMAGRLAAGLSGLFMLMSDYDQRSNAGLGVFGMLMPGVNPKLAAAGFLLVAAWLIGRGVQWSVRRWWPDHDHQVAVMLRLVVAGIVMTNGFFFGQYLMRHQRGLNYTPPNRATATPALTPTEQRDVYYLVFDRYASQSTLRNYYDYDNSDLLSYLGKQGFTLRDTAYSNYQFTAPSISSTMRMDYHSDVQRDLGSSTVESYLPYRKILEDSPVSRLFAQAGYNVTRLSSWYGVTREEQHGETVDPQFELTLFGRTIILSDLQSTILDRTVFAPLLRNGLSLGPIQLAHYNVQDAGQLVLDQLSALRTAAATPHSQPNFIFAHILSPHPQYVFLPDGSKPSYDAEDTDYGAPRELKYTNQLQFLNAQIKRTISAILASSHTPPVIIIQSDEGPYPPEFRDYSQQENGPFAWDKASADTLRYKFGILAAYYLPDVPDDRKAELNSNVNAFRFVFNHYLGGSFAYLPDCSLLFDGKQPFAFYDVTAKLRGAGDPACRGYAALGTLE